MVTIKQLFADYDGDYVLTEFDWGEDVGREIIEDEEEQADVVQSEE